jgi:hypothetical protein
MQERAQIFWRMLHATMFLAEFAYQRGRRASNTADSSRHRLWMKNGRCELWTPRVIDRAFLVGREIGACGVA